MPTRRTPLVVGAGLVALVVVSGCGSQPAPREAGVPSQNSTQVNGTRPSPPIPNGFQDPTGFASQEPTTAPTRSPDTRSFSITDRASGDFVAGLGNGDVVIGGVGIHGLGAAWGLRKVQVTRTSQGLVARYDGRGKLQRGASLDYGFATFATLTDSDLGDPEPVRLRFDVQLDADGLGHADVWIDGQHFHLVATEPPHTAEPVVTAVVAAMRAQDWSAMYDLTVHLPGMSRSDFVRAFGGDGSISSLELTGETAYRVENGVGYADTPAHVVATLGQRHLDRDVSLELVYRAGEWRFNSLANGMNGN